MGSGRQEPPVTEALQGRCRWWPVGSGGHEPPETEALQGRWWWAPVERGGALSTSVWRW